MYSHPVRRSDVGDRRGGRIPLFTITSSNMNSCSAYPNGIDARKRQRRKIAHVKELKSKNEVVFLQETRLNRKDRSFLNNNEDGSKVFYSNEDSTHAGVATIISKKLCNIYNPIQIRRQGSPDQIKDADGRVLQIYMEPKNKHYRGFYLDNLYLQSGSDMAHKMRQIRAIKHNSDDLIFMGGDFNFTEMEGDGGIRLRGLAAKTWKTLCQRLGLKEIYQGAHTYVNGQNSSRIDRFYSNLDEADRLLYSPIAFMRKTDSLLYHEKLRNTGDYHFTDHHPVSLPILSTETSKNRDFNCPKWLAEEQEFIWEFRNLWARKNCRGDDYFACLALWKKCITSATKTYFTNAKNRKKNFSTNSARISRATSLLRLLRAETQDIERIRSALDTDHDLAEIISWDDNCDLWMEGELASWVHEQLMELIMEKKNYEPDVISETLSTSTGGARRPGPVEALKNITPCSRDRLSAMRGHMDDPPSSDPQLMGKLVVDNWTQLWSRRERLTPIEESMNNFEYDKTVDTDEIYQPTSADYEDVIRNTNNSCAGPDGIPFAIYRAFIDTIAPILAGVGAALSRGVLPPNEACFNFARLFMIPKGGTMMPLDHRPISVANGDNRIIATAAVRAISPAVEDLIDPSQKGFVPGRKGEDNIDNLLNFYYSKLDKKKQAFVLLMDIEKAFDSVAHDYIHHILDHIGMPAWFQNMVKGLLTDVQVNPIMTEKFEGMIQITRGVKQGCPLSPILFIICYDPLLHRLSNKNCIQPFGFADDLAAACDNPGSIVTVLNIFRAFTKLSGLKINEKKTVIVAESSLWTRTKAFLDINSWKDIVLADSGIYLGIRFGNVTTELIYEKAMKKFRKRFAAYRPLFKKLPIHKRTLLANVLLLTLFSYVGQFYVMPPSVYNEAKESLRKAVIPFAGGAFAYAHAVNVDANSIRLATPLKDIWALNMTWLATKTALNSCHGMLLASFADFEHVNDEGWGDSPLSFRPIEHRVHAALVYLDDYGKRTEGTIQATDLVKGSRTARKTVYDAFSSLGWFDHLASRSSLKLKAKLKKWGIREGRSENAEKVVGARSSDLRIRVSPQTWDFFIRLLFNALPFHKRLNDASLKDENGNAFPDVCYFCGLGQDSAIHVYRDCVAVMDIRASAQLSSVGCTIEDVLLAREDMTKVETRQMLTFNYSIWRIRMDYLLTLTTHPGISAISGRVLTHFHGSMEGVKQKRAISGRLESFLSSPPPDAALYFTDGSASPNPGPCGAGCYRAKGPLPELYAATSLGHGTNNIGELYALGMALRCIIDSPPVEFSVIFTDSDYAHGLLERNNRVGLNRVIILALKRLLLEARATGIVHISWIKAHAGFHGNKMADQLAKDGAEENSDVSDTGQVDFLYKPMSASVDFPG